ncbi:MAG: Fe-S cluster assembly protein SufD [Candidatus Marinimicrobia bacterium]|nr:Fe-S cluster assembly protein SufD [Candidatus Neomarinimicrobiota bacterium]
MKNNDNMMHLRLQLNDLLNRMPDKPAKQSRVAFDAFRNTGFPTTKWEDWRFTSVSDLQRADWRLSLPSDLPSDLSGISTDTGITPYSINFINGHFQPHLSFLPPEVEIFNLTDFYNNNSLPIFDVQHKHDPFYLLNTALFDSGQAIIIPDNTTIEKPIDINYIKTGFTDLIMFQPRTIIQVGSGSEVSIIESHVGDNNLAYFTNNRSEIQVGTKSRLNYLSFQEDSLQAYHIHSVVIDQERNSLVSAGFFNIGSLLSCNNVLTHLNGEGAELNMFGLSQSANVQHMDIQSIVYHNSPNCSSTQLFKNILSGRSKGVFKGQVIVSKDAQKTDARQSNKNILLSNDARMNSDPQLEIYADDVKCSHGSTTGAMDEDAIFYLRSRGLDLFEAKSLLIDGFAGEIIHKISDKNIRKIITQKIRNLKI